MKYLITCAILCNSMCWAGEIPDIKYLFTIKELSQSESLKDPNSLFVEEKKGEIFVTDAGLEKILVFDRDGRLIRRIDGDAMLKAPLGIAVTGDGEIYVTESDTSKVKLLDYKGRLSSGLDISGLPLTAPGRLAIDGEDNVYFIDRLEQKVIVTDRHGKLKFILGRKDTLVASSGKEPGEFKMLQDITIDREKGLVYIVSALGTAVHVFDTRGDYIMGFGEHIPQGGGFSFPSACAIDSRGRVWVADGFQHSLKVFTQKGDFLFNWGKMGEGEGELLFPVDLTFDSNGRLYILEKGNSRVQVFNVEN